MADAVSEKPANALAVAHDLENKLSIAEWSEGLATQVQRFIAAMLLVDKKQFSHRMNMPGLSFMKLAPQTHKTRSQKLQSRFEDNRPALLCESGARVFPSKAHCT